jgi:hypothetical protein
VTSFIRLYTKEGGYYCIHPSFLLLLDAVRNGTNIAEWLTLEFVADGTEVYIRTDEIQSYFLSTPESRRAASEWEETINEPEEPWKQS